MKISGFTIIKNAVINDYPIVEAIMSILPVVDEMIVLVGDSKDDTEGLILSINSPKIKVHHSVWDPSLREGGKVLAAETNKAFQLIDPASTWAFYIQADEVVHEKDHAAIWDACNKYKDDTRVQGLLFKYIHFYGSFDFIGDSRQWYRNEVRIIRNDKKISSYKDAQGFRIGEQKLLVKPVNAGIYHYGWVKSLEQMRTKMKEVARYWNKDGKKLTDFVEADNIFNFEDFDSLAKFTGTHPAVMETRIKTKNWKLDIDISKKKLSSKDKVHYWIEKLTGIRLFEFRNYKLLR